MVDSKDSSGNTTPQDLTLGIIKADEPQSNSVGSDNSGKTIRALHAQTFFHDFENE